MPQSVKKSFYRFVALLVLFSLALAPSARQVQAADKVLRIKGREFSRFDPQLTASTAQASLENALFRGLLRYDENGNPVPSIAAEVPSVANKGISADGKTYTYKLRDWNW